jgi:hypothetical protein
MVKYSRGNRRSCEGEKDVKYFMIVAEYKHRSSYPHKFTKAILNQFEQKSIKKATNVNRLRPIVGHLNKNRNMKFISNLKSAAENLSNNSALNRGILFDTVLYKKPQIICRAYIAGLMYYDFEMAAKHLIPGSNLDLKREPKNTFDRYAISVWCGHYKLGYIPHNVNKAVANIMDHSRRDITASVVYYDLSGNLFEAIKMEVQYE